MNQQLLIALAPKIVFEKAKKLKADGDYEGALRILENNIVEFEVNESAGIVSAKILREPRKKMEKGFKKGNSYTEKGTIRNPMGIN